MEQLDRAMTSKVSITTEYAPRHLTESIPHQMEAGVHCHEKGDKWNVGFSSQ